MWEKQGDQNTNENKNFKKTKDLKLEANEQQRREKKQPMFWEGSDTMRYSAIWLSVCWATTMCCPSWLVWICWAGPDGLLKTLPYGKPEFLHNTMPHSDFKLLLLLLWLSSLLLFIRFIFCVSESNHCATKIQNVWIRIFAIKSSALLNLRILRW